MLSQFSHLKNYYSKHNNYHLKNFPCTLETNSELFRELLSIIRVIILCCLQKEEYDCIEILIK